MKALARMAALPENSIREKGLSEEDWRLLKIISEFLGPFAKVTKLMEGSKYSTLSGVVPLFNKLLYHAEDWSVDVKMCDFIRKGAKAAFTKLNKYYDKVGLILIILKRIRTHFKNLNQDLSLQLVATVLDPRMKLSYLKKNGWNVGEDGRNLIDTSVMPA